MRVINTSIHAFIFFLVLFSAVFAYGVEPINVAAIYAKTGVAHEANKGSIEGAKLAINEINRQGGLLGRNLKLIVIDNKSTPIGSKIAAREAVKLNVAAVIGAQWSSHSLPIANVLQNAGIPMITPASTNPKITKVGNYIFRACFDDEFQGKILADFAYNHLGARTAVIVTNIEERYSLTLSQFFKDSFIKNKGEVLWNGNYENKTADFFDLFLKIFKYKPDVVFIPGYGNDSGLFIKKAVKMKINSIFLGGDGWDDMDIKKYGGNYLEGSYYSTHWHPSISSARYVRLKEIYKKKFGSDEKFSNFMLPITYDAVMLLAEAIRRAGSPECDKIRDALSQTVDFKGITGNITFDANGDPIDKEISILKFTNESQVFIKSVKPDTIKIASIFSHTGKAAKHNRPSIQGVRFAVQEINKSGGILQKQLQLVEIDNFSSSIGSKLAARKAVKTNMTAIIGAAWSSHSLQVAKIAQANKIPMISNISTNPNVTKVGDYIFRACFTDSYQGRVLANFARKDLMANSACIVVDLGSKYSMGLANEFKKSFEKSGGEILSQQGYETGQEQFNEIISQLKKIKFDILFIPGHDESGSLIKKVLENRISMIPMGGDGWNNKNFFTNGGDKLKQGYYCTHWTENIRTDISHNFIQNYTKYQSVNDKSALAYDSVMLLTDAIKRAGSIERSDIRNSLAKTVNFNGVTGKISFDAHGDPIKSAVIMQISNGKAIFLKSLEPSE